MRPKANTDLRDEYWKLYDQFTSTLKKLAASQDALDASRRALNDAQATAEFTGQEKEDMITSLREKDSAELAQMRNDWDETSQKVHSLQAEIDSSLTLVNQTCTERDELRAVLDDRQAMIAESRVEDHETMEEMKALLAEIAGQDSGDASEASQKSGVELTKQVVELIEKNLERLAKRAEVSADFLSNPKSRLCLQAIPPDDTSSVVALAWVPNEFGL